PRDPRIAGRIVFLGGTYSTADRHSTPWGPKDGVKLHAMAVEAAFRGTSQSHAFVLPFKLLFKLLLAFAIAATYHWLRPIPAAIATVILLPVAVWLSGTVMFWLGNYEIGVVPFIVGILLEQQVSLVERSHHRSFHRAT